MAIIYKISPERREASLKELDQRHTDELIRNFTYLDQLEAELQNTKLKRIERIKLLENIDRIHDLNNKLDDLYIKHYTMIINGGVEL